MAKGRTTFAVAGDHPCLQLVTKQLLFAGCELVGVFDDTDPDLVLLGSQGNLFSARTSDELDELAGKKCPTLVLSSSAVYTDRTHTLQAADRVPLEETTPHVVTSVLEPAMGRTLASLLTEWRMVQSSRAVILRTFNVYGPDLRTGVIPSFIEAAKAGKPLEVHGSGYQTRAFLHQDDFLRCTEVMVRKLLNGHKGVYNVGHDQETTITRLADTVWQLQHKTSDPAPTTSIQPGRYYAQYKVANLTRVKAAANWKPTISYRQGIWRILEDETNG